MEPPQFPSEPPVPAKPPHLPDFDHEVPTPPNAIPEPPAPAVPGNPIRPWWGLGDALLGIPFIITFAIAGLVAAGIYEFLANGEVDFEDTAGLSAAAIGLAALGQQTGQAVWPWVVSRWKGLGMASDWKLVFKPIDLVIGVGAGIASLAVATAVSTVAAALVRLEDESAAENTAFLTDNSDSPWLILLIFIAVVGAPVSEELLFRGLILQAFKNRGGPLLALAGSTIVFTLVHFPSEFSLGGMVVLWATIASIGLILGALALRVDRLWPCIIAHVVFNAIGVAGALLLG